MADQVASKMSKSSAKTSQKSASPKKGEKFRCSECGMEIQVTGECGCNDPNHVHFQCCNQEMARA